MNASEYVFAVAKHMLRSKATTQIPIMARNPHVRNTLMLCNTVVKVSKIIDLLQKYRCISIPADMNIYLYLKFK